MINPVVMSITGVQTVVLKDHFSLKETRAFQKKKKKKKGLIPYLGQDTHNISLEHLALPKSKQAIRDYQGHDGMTHKQT